MAVQKCICDPAIEGLARARSSKKVTVNWQKVSQRMNRTPKDCQHKWNSMQASKLKKGPFTAEEDAVITQRVAEWGNKGIGLWVSLEKELGRSATIIGGRWRNVLSKGK